jgi:hypothetical protein
MTTYFAPVPNDQESVVALVTREAREECRHDRLPPLVLDHFVREAVASLRGGHVTTFVPLLALRRVRACIRARTCDCDEW